MAAIIAQTTDEAVAGISDGSTVLVSGFGTAGTPFGLIDALVRHGASDFDSHHADSFAMIRGRHGDVCVLGAYQVSDRGDLANWHTDAAHDIPAVGGAMDLAAGTKQVHAMMTLFTKDGVPKLVRRCTYPLTHRACVSRVYTDYGLFTRHSVSRWPIFLIASAARSRGRGRRLIELDTLPTRWFPRVSGGTR